MHAGNTVSLPPYLVYSDHGRSGAQYDDPPVAGCVYDQIRRRSVLSFRLSCVEPLTLPTSRGDDTLPI
jgi:hypothetical protein